VAITTADIIEAIYDDLVVAFADRSPHIAVRRTGPGALDLDYGDAGHFVLVVTEQNFAPDGWRVEFR
jgi:hypothetical protein